MDLIKKKLCSTEKMAEDTIDQRILKKELLRYWQSEYDALKGMMKVDSYFKLQKI